MRQTRILTEGAMACAVFATLLIISVYLPLISLVSLWFLPLPFAVYTIRHGIRPGLVAFLAGLFLGFILSALPGLIWALTFGSGGVTTGWLYRQKRTAFAVLLGGSLVYIANVLFIYILSIVLLQTDIIQDSIDLVRKSIEQAQNMAGALGGAEENLKFLDAYLRQLKYFAPTLLVSAGVIYAFLTQWVQGRVLRKIGFAEYVLPWKPFREWQLPKSILWYYLAVLLLLFFVRLEEGSLFFIAVVNVFLLLEILLAIQGWSFIFFFAHEKGIHKSFPIAIVVFSLLLQILLYLVRFLGIIDLGFDLRKRIRKQ